MSIDFRWLEHELGVPPQKAAVQKRLSELFEVINAPPDMPIAHQGHLGNSLYFLHSGKIRVSRISKTGNVVPLPASEQIKVFGEMSFFTGEPVSASVVAEEYCVVYQITRENFHALMQEHPEIAMCLMTVVVKNMANVIKNMDGRFSRLY